MGALGRRHSEPEGGSDRATEHLHVGNPGTAAAYINDPRRLSWTDGTPTASNAADINGLYIGGIGQGFSITAPADTTSRTLVVHVGGYQSGGTLTADLSDGSAANFTNTTATAGGQYDRNYTLTYRRRSRKDLDGDLDDELRAPAM